uniref:Uncharacterized protein n=1 Tax=Cairina moschata TaxID=8855 RepID=A0A8C3BY64_CAIMO
RWHCSFCITQRSLALISLSPEAEGGRSETVSCPGLCWKHLAHLVCIPRGKEMWSCNKSHLQMGQHHRHGIRLGCTWPCYQLLLQSS